MSIAKVQFLLMTKLDICIKLIEGAMLKEDFFDDYVGRVEFL